MDAGFGRFSKNGEKRIYKPNSPSVNEIFYRPVTLEDAQGIARAIVKDNTYFKYMYNWPDPYTPKDAEAFVQSAVYERQQGTAFHFTVHNHLHLVGIGGIYEINKHKTCSLGLWVSPTYSNKGLGTCFVKYLVEYAFGQIGLDRICSTVVDKNRASIKILKRNGFLLEGRLRKHVIVSGNRTDLLLFGLLKKRCISD